MKPVGLLGALVVGAMMGAGQYLGASDDAPVGISLVSSDAALTDPGTLATDGVNLYLGNGRSIVSVAIDSGAVTTLYAEAASSKVNGLTRVGTDLFWIDPSGDQDATAIFRGSTTGGPVSMVYSGLTAEQIIMEGADIASGGSKLFTTDYVQGQLHSVNDDGSAPTFLGANFGGGIESAHLSTIDYRDGILYVADSGFLPEVSAPHLFSVPATGGAALTLHSGAPFAGIADVAVGDGFVFVADQQANTIWQVPAAGGPPTALVAGAPFVQVAGIVYWQNALYVTDTGNTATWDGPGAVYKISLPTPNTAPAADDQSVRTARNAPVGVTLSATDADGDPLTYIIADTPEHGTLSGVVPAVVYTPAAGYAGPDSFRFAANDGMVNSNVATVSIDVRLSTTTALVSSVSSSLFGQPVTFTATVANGSTTPRTGSVQFFDGASPLGVATLVSGSASLTTTTVNAGSRSITAVYGGDSNNEGSTSPAIPMTVSKTSTTTSVTVSPSTRQYSDRVSFQATVTPANPAAVQPPATSVTFKIGSQEMGTAPLVPAGTGYKAVLPLVPLLEPQSPPNQLMAGSKMVTAVFNEVNQNFTVSTAYKLMTITREDARATYTGPKTAKTTSADRRKATVRLSATVKDISATPEGLADTDPGDIRKAMLAFVNRETGVTIANVPVTLVNEADKTTGTVSYDWTVDIGNVSSKTFKIGLVVSSYYTRNVAADDVLITVSK